MNFFTLRKYRKITRHLLHELHHVRHMRMDIATPAQMAALDAVEQELRAAWDRRSPEGIEAAADRLYACVARMYPRRVLPRLAENVEIFAVALAVAMGLRTYFIQPFKIPTGSMQPTLYGITVREQRTPGTFDRFPLNLAAMALFGERYVEVKAKESGKVDPRYRVDLDNDSFVYFIAGKPHRIRRGLYTWVSPGEHIARGQVLASGRIQLGDHIFVDKVRFNFARPRRGDIIVFKTDRIAYPQIRTDSFYIKRLVALPGEQVALDPPYLVINGERITEPYPFRRLVEQTDKGYLGYQLPHRQGETPVFLAAARTPQRLGRGEYLPFGDNTAFSLDGRYFGPILRDALVGPAFFTYWPFTRRWGRTH